MYITKRARRAEAVRLASFKALNVESEDEVDEEPDNTRELQIEDALKIYQTALKLQSQGPDYVKETEDAYESLFESELFRYPESLSEYNRVENYGGQGESYGQILVEQDASNFNTNGTTDNAPSTLPQVLHLSYKNRGQLHLDALSLAVHDGRSALELERDIRIRAVKALNDFAEALDKDADDVDVWRRAARAGQLLGSQAVSRFCLEAVVDGDEQATDDVLGDAGMDIKVADHDLRQVKDAIGDVVSTGPTVAHSTDMPASWREHLRFYKDLPNLEPLRSRERAERFEVETKHSWAAIGETILRQVSSELHGSSRMDPGVGWCFHTAEVFGNGSKDFVANSSTLADSVGVISSADDKAAVIRRRTTSSTDNIIEDTTAVAQEQNDTPKSPMTISLPTRKRTSEAAELPDNADGPRGRSKRLRARESLVGDGRDGEPKPAAESLEIEQRIKHTAQGDEWLFEMLRPMTAKVGIKGHKSSLPYRKLVRKEEGDSPIANDLPLAQAVKDFYNAMQNWNDSKTKAILEAGHSRATSAGAGTGQNTLLNFLETSSSPKRKATDENFKVGLTDFIEKVNNGWFSTSAVACEWICNLCSSYTQVAWTAELKQIVCQLVVELDTLLYARIEGMSEAITWEAAENSVQTEVEVKPAALILAQTLFEIHLDILAKVSSIGSGASKRDRTNQASRTIKWSNLARDAMSFHFQQPAYDADDSEELFIRTRHLWASVFQMQIQGDEAQDNIIVLLSHLKQELDDAGTATFELPNNATFPELSSSAIEREISKLRTVDFFHTIFEKENQLPVDLIESLEPLLEQTVEPREIIESETTPTIGNAESEKTEEAVTKIHSEAEHSEKSPSTLGVLSEFIHKASMPLRLLLWMRLRDAYRAIDYPPKIFSVQLRCIQVAVERLKGEQYEARSEEDRVNGLLDTTRDLRELLDSIWNLVRDVENIFDCIDINHLRASMQAVFDLWIILYPVSLFDDYSQLGGKGGPTINPFRAYPSDTFHNASIKLHNMQVETAILLYKLFCETMVQLPELFPNPAEDRLQLLRYVHYHFGIRKMCKAHDGAFLHFMKDELMTNLPEVEHSSSNDLAQVLYDLYDLHCFSGPLERQDHGCDSDHLDHQTAMQLVDFVLERASRTSVKDLLKSDLGKAVEKLHTTLNWVVRSNPGAIRNRKFYSALLRSPILPLDLYRAFQGLSNISAIPVNPGDAIVASKGWFYLKGQIALGKYQVQRAKGTRGSEDDLHQANAFFQQDLEFSPERWETWYRMAQTQEGLIENDIMWSAEDINNDLPKLVNIQRTAIHAYIMAVSAATRVADSLKETKQKISDLYYDFAVCLYGASRKPFSMKAFSFEDFSQKWFSPSNTMPHQDRSFTPLLDFQAWHFAAVLLTKCTKLNPHNWMIHYMLAKCLWKLHGQSDKRESSRRKAQKAFMRALRALPERKDYARQEPLFEPIYKIVSTTFKLVERKEISAEGGAATIEKCLSTQKQIDASKRPKYEESTSWDEYAVDVLKILRNADKSRWHHRFVLRAAKIMQRQCENAEEGASAAKQYLIDQHIYSTKTLAVTLWKPEHERPGRRWVYAHDYTLYIGELLERTNDLEGMQLLAKRVRRKPTEYFDHVELWTKIVEMHVRLHRRHANVKHGLTEVVFKAVDQDEFRRVSAKIDEWIANPQDLAPIYVVLREAVELKKINSALIKPTVIDELLTDAYAELWAQAKPYVQAPPGPGPSFEIKAERPATPANYATATPPVEERRGVMSLHSMMHMDGASDPGTPPTPPRLAGQADLTGVFASRPRTRLISRREVVKRATDAVALRPVTRAATPPALLPSSEDASHITVVVNAPSRRGSLEATVEDGVPTAATTPEGSVDDDADDESELSDIEEEEVNEDEAMKPKPLFPGLIQRLLTGGNDDGSSAQDGDEQTTPGTSPPAPVSHAGDQMEVD